MSTTKRTGYFDWAATGNRRSSAAGRAARAEQPTATRIGTAVFGMLGDAYSAFHDVQLKQIETRSAADWVGHRGRLLEFDYRAAVRQAQSEIEAGQAQAGDVRLAGSQQRAAIEASAAASGVDVGGSGAEVLASERLIEDIDVYHITLASVIEANEARRQAVAIENEQRMARVEERNLRRTAKYAQPEAQLVAGLLNYASRGYSMGAS